MGKKEPVLTKESVQHIAKLARLTLTDTEANAYTNQLSAILDSFNEISKINTSNIEPMITPIDMTMQLRPDGAEKNGTTEELLESAPARSGNLYKVPPVV